jgi:putative membrane protein
MMGYYWGYDGYGPMGGWNIFGGIMMLAFWVIVITLIVIAVKKMSGFSKYDNHNNSALDILKGRYAKGEIDKREFEEKKKDIES